MAAIIAVKPPRYAITTRSKRLMRCTTATEISPAMVEKNVVRRMGRKMSDGLAAPIWAR